MRKRERGKIGTQSKCLLYEKKYIEEESVCVNNLKIIENHTAVLDMINDPFNT